MPKLSPQEDPREEGKTNHPDSYSLPQRRYRSTGSGLPPKIFNPDEHPEIPKIKRASRVSNIHNSQPATPAKSRRRINRTSIQNMSELQIRPAYDQLYQKRQMFPLVTSLQRYTPRQKLITTGCILLTVLLLIMIVITTTHQLSAMNIQEQANGQDTNSMVPHGTGGNKSGKIAIAQSHNGHPAPPVLATSAYLLDADTGATLYVFNPSMHQPMLSTTKLMTALVATQLGDPNQSIVITDTTINDINQLSADSSLMGIKKGETYTLKDLLYGLLLVSGNDAAVAIADQMGGGKQQNFVDKMNQEAVKLGLLDTHYVNPHGLLAPGQFSSAHDLALLAKYSLKVPLIHTISSTREYDIPKNAMHDKHQMLNENQFLWWYPGVDGGKPGWDAETDFVQVISCVRNHHHLIGAVMHTVDWWTDMRDLMNWGFNTYDWISPHETSANDAIPYAADWHYFYQDTKETTIPTPDHGRYYIYTGYSISGPIMAYFDTNGGLNTFGFPISQATTLSNGVLSQRFEHSTIRCDKRTKKCLKT